MRRIFKSKKRRIAELYNDNIGVKVGNFNHPHSRKEGCVALGVVCGYGDSDLVVKMTDGEGWFPEGMRKAKIKFFIEPESKGNVKGYWFISKRELEELSVVYDNDESIVDPGRNEPCFCGSGKKFKKCCLHPVQDVD